MYYYLPKHLHTNYIMITPDFLIDSIQGIKRTVTNMVIKDIVLNQAANSYIDAQTQFAKMLANNTLEVTRYAMDQFCNKLFSKG